MSSLAYAKNMYVFVGKIARERWSFWVALGAGIGFMLLETTLSKIQLEHIIAPHKIFAGVILCFIFLALLTYLPFKLGFYATDQKIGLRSLSPALFLKIVTVMAVYLCTMVALKSIPGLISSIIGALFIDPSFIFATYAYFRSIVHYYRHLKLVFNWYQEQYQ